MVVQWNSTYKRWIRSSTRFRHVLRQVDDKGNIFPPSSTSAGRNQTDEVSSTLLSSIFRNTTGLHVLLECVYCLLLLFRLTTLAVRWKKPHPAYSLDDRTVFISRSTVCSLTSLQNGKNVDLASTGRSLRGNSLETQLFNSTVFCSLKKKGDWKILISLRR